MLESRRKKKLGKPLSLLPLLALIFYDVSGGPFGCEDAVSSGGPLLAILGFVVLPFVWSVPEALVTAELATAFPENAGYVTWVSAAFGPFWGWQEGFWSWLSGVTDNALYPVMFAAYLSRFVPVLNEDGHVRTVFVLVACLVLTYLNYRGLHVVGPVAVVCMVVILAPFIVFLLLGAPRVNPANWLVVDLARVQWTDYLNVMFWNLNYWDSISTLVGEVQNPTRTVPRALFLAMIIVVLTYLLPLVVGLGLSDASWQLGSFEDLATQVGGRGLGVCIVIAAAVSQVGQFETEMSSDAYQVQGMAERGYVPKFLGRRSRYGTPTYGILLSSIGIVAIVALRQSQFLRIVNMLNVIYCLAELTEFAAFIKLRISRPDLERGFRVPLPVWALVIMLLPASCLLLLLLALPFWNLDWALITWTAGTITVSSCLYPLLQAARVRGWCKFTGDPEDLVRVTSERIHDYLTITPDASSHQLALDEEAPDRQNTPPRTRDAAGRGGMGISPPPDSVVEPLLLPSDPTD